MVRLPPQQVMHERLVEGRSLRIEHDGVGLHAVDCRSGDDERRGVHNGVEEELAHEVACGDECE